jgi:hypothetical protein
MQSLTSLVKERENTYVNGTANISKYVDYSQYETISTVEAYLNSKHISGSEDALGREKPFFNVVTSVANIWMRATDIDRKNIKFKATKVKHIIPAFLANIILQDWMKRTNFGSFLNDWGRTLARYGSAITKFVEKDGVLHINVTPWNKLITDQIDFESNVKIFKFFLTPAQLKANPIYKQDVVESIIDAKQTRTTLNDQTIDTLSDYIEIYEVQGNLPLSMITEEEKDDDTYVDQIHIISFNGDKEDFTLYSGKLKKQQYHKADLIKEDGRAMGIGAVEYLFPAQWMANHAIKLAKDQLELVSKVIYQTADKNYAGRNALTSIENGDIFIHEPNSPLTQVNNQGHDLTSLQNFMTQWQNQAKEITSTPDAIMGNTMPSGTAYRQVAILNQESHSLFELMTENKGIALEEMFREWIIPYIKTKLNTKEEIVAVLDSMQVKQLDTWYLNTKAMKIVNRKIIDEVLNGNMVSPEEQDEMFNKESAELQAQLGQLGNTRYLKPSEIDDKTWKDIFKDFDWEIEVEVTNEQSDKEAMMTTLTTVLQAVAQNPNILQDQTMKTIFSKIIEHTGALSSIEISQMSAQPQPSPEAIEAPIGGN